MSNTIASMHVRPRDRSRAHAFELSNDVRFNYSNAV